MQSGIDSDYSWNIPSAFNFSINPLGGNVGIGVLDATAQLHTKGRVRLEGLGTNTVDTKILTTDGLGNVTTRPISSFSFTSPTINIYTDDGTLEEDRVVDLKQRFLNFDAFSTADITSIFHPLNFASQLDAFSSIKTSSNFQTPNTIGWGMSNIQHISAGVTLTQGITENATWLQSGQLWEGNWPEGEGYNLLINTKGGYVGVNVSNPLAQFHTNGELMFEGLNASSENTVLTIYPNGLVSTRNLNTIVNTITGNATVTATLTGNNFQLNSPNQIMSIAGNTLSLTNNGSATTTIQLPPQVLEPVLMDPYLGTRLRPVDTTINGFQVKRGVIGDVGYTAINRNTTENGSPSYV
ncbi:unnamed protein product, partial [Rotaria socialis]